MDIAFGSVVGSTIETRGVTLFRYAVRKSWANTLESMYTRRFVSSNLSGVADPLVTYTPCFAVYVWAIPLRKRL